MSNNISVEDIKYIDNLKPVFILLTSWDSFIVNKAIKKFTNSDINHASISLDPKLEEMYSFMHSADNYGKQVSTGFIKENIKILSVINPKKPTEYVLYVLFVTPEQNGFLSKQIESFVTTAKKWKYNILGLFTFLFKFPLKRRNSMFCSQFVAELIKSVNSELIDVPPELVSPEYLKKTKQIHYISNGILKNYDYNHTLRTIEKLKEKIKHEKVNINSNDVRNESLMFKEFINDKLLSEMSWLYEIDL